MATWQRRSGIMLCYPFEEKRLSKWPKPWIIQPKLDGDRCRALIDGEGNVQLLSSEGNEIVSVPHINQQLEALDLRNVELDGELYKHGWNHQSIHSVVSREKNIRWDFDEIEYHIFDIIFTGNMGNRYIHLRDMEKNIDQPNIQIVAGEVVSSMEEIEEFSDRMTVEGYEGFVIRNAFGYYKRSRSTDIMKFKPRKEDLYTIVGVQQEVDQHGNPKEALGALLCRSHTGEETFGVGSGPFLTREARIELWKHKEHLPGLVARVKYQHLTPKHVPRFPVLVEVVII